ncbi:unnamed protein product [Lasius platythorax]|uniref:BESS domain-containing protein n=1 Tax=Lasius platythorax TaxID=488582 RepID=A0AAV2NU72_9HYME
MTNIHNIQNKSVPPVTGYSNIQKNFGSHDEKENNSSSVNVATLSKQPSIKSIVDLTDNTPRHVGKDSLTPNLHSNVSDSSSISASVSGYTRDNGLIGQRIKLKGKSQPDVLENAIGKVTSLLENRCVPVSSTPSSLKPEIEEDMAFCQLILSLFVNMSQCTKADKKKAVLRILFDM